MKNRVVDIAIVAFQVNKAISETLGDTSVKDWGLTTQENRDYMVRRVEEAIVNPDDVFRWMGTAPIESCLKARCFRAVVLTMMAEDSF